MVSWGSLDLLVAKRHPSACVHHLPGTAGRGMTGRQRSSVAWGPGQRPGRSPVCPSRVGRKPARGGRADTQRSRLLPVDRPTRAHRHLPPKPMARSRLPAGVTANRTTYGGIGRKIGRRQPNCNPKCPWLRRRLCRVPPISTTPHGDGRSEGDDQGGSRRRGTDSYPGERQGGRRSEKVRRPSVVVGRRDPGGADDPGRRAFRATRLGRHRQPGQVELTSPEEGNQGELVDTGRRHSGVRRS